MEIFDKINYKIKIYQFKPLFAPHPGDIIFPLIRLITNREKQHFETMQLTLNIISYLVRGKEGGKYLLHNSEVLG